MRARHKRVLKKLWNEWCKPLLVVVIVVCSFRSAVADWHDVPTGSMKPTIIEGDRILVNKLAYDLKFPLLGWQMIEWGGPERGDVVVCSSPENGIRLVKRVIGLPGDRVEMRDNVLHINGAPVAYESLDAETISQIDINERGRHAFAAEDFGDRKHAVMATPGLKAARTFGPMTVPAEHYLVLGDNRDCSRDSRFFGFVPRSSIAGEAFAVAFSLDYQDYYLPRGDRFIRKLR